MDNQDKIKTALKVCHLYYEDGLSQGEIAAKLLISRPTISRLLQFARDQGLLKIEIMDPLKDLDVLAKQLENKYHLKKVILIFDATNDLEAINPKIGAAAADYLDTIVKDQDSIGISWGETLESVANHLHPSKANNVSVVQLKGSVSGSEMNNFANDIINKFSNAFKTDAINLPLPVIFDNATTKKVVMQDRFIKAIIQAGIKANIALFTSGTVRDDAMLFNLGYLTQAEISRLQSQAVGDVVSRFITATGEIANTDIDDRTVGIPLSALRDKEYSILISGSSRKVASIRGALLGGYANVLITDSQTAAALLD
ncbi:sugar-binding transcriptional regulator [Lactiplantibacillus sp. WILCCON 0030]|uniref:Sugar-binding transcriptional regulator n=1 Tax=Lactiplantibacillus brownii TaxID=3069269 RepID=A0ABU1AE57_9LACO|nr:sugar-binding transcriptional regulator [Lactiplantibacillus brownii]MDQ7938525.1 sugar-binding transcriptional regulator [Lactiplantibacillus brownii]